jgi:hypothetical protein
MLKDDDDDDDDNKCKFIYSISRVQFFPPAWNSSAGIKLIPEDNFSFSMESSVP